MALDGKEHRSESVLLATPAVVLDDRERRRTVVEGQRAPFGVGLRPQMRPGTTTPAT